MIARPSRVFWVLLAFAATWLPQAGFACAVCFGDSQAPVTKGINFFILTLLGITLGVLGGAGGFMVYLARKSAAISRAQLENGRQP